MTLLELLTKASRGVSDLRLFLLRAGEKYPDLAPKANEYVALLDAAVATDNLVSVASALPGEIANIARGRIEPKSHPSDAV